MNKQILKDGLLWGFLVWLFGFAVSMVLFLFIPVALLGWFIFPLWLAFTAWVLLKMVRIEHVRYALRVGALWVVIAVALDYLIIVILFRAEGYYTFDVLLYYAITFVLPVAATWWRSSRKTSLTVS